MLNEKGEDMEFRFYLNKKKIDTTAAMAFWSWFAENERSIIDRCKTDAMRLIYEIDQKLRPVFPYFKGELEFQLGFNDGRGEFFFFHLGNRHLIKDSETLGSLMPDSLRQRWKYIIEK